MTCFCIQFLSFISIIDKITQNVVNEKKKMVFKIFKKHNADDDDTKIDDDKKIFNLKTILHKIIRKKKEKNDSNSQNKQ